jgi:hypothetical protein
MGVNVTIFFANGIRVYINIDDTHASSTGWFGSVTIHLRTVIEQAARFWK